MRKLYRVIFVVVAMLCLWNGIACAGSWTCPNCHQTFPYDSRDAARITGTWIPIHLNACRGRGGGGATYGGGYNNPGQQALYEAGQAFGENLSDAVGGIIAHIFLPGLMRKDAEAQRQQQDAVRRQQEEAARQQAEIERQKQER